MSNQCKNCDMRDTNNNYLSTNLNLIHNNNNTNNNNSHRSNGTTANNRNNNNNRENNNINVTCQAKVMWGKVDAISELREKEQADKKRMPNPNRKDQ